MTNIEHRHICRFSFIITITTWRNPLSLFWMSTQYLNLNLLDINVGTTETRICVYPVEGIPTQIRIYTLMQKTSLQTRHIYIYEVGSPKLILLYGACLFYLNFNNDTNSLCFFFHLPGYRDGYNLSHYIVPVSIN